MSSHCLLTKKNHWLLMLWYDCEEPKEEEDLDVLNELIEASKMSIVEEEETMMMMMMMLIMMLMMSMHDLLDSHHN